MSPIVKRHKGKLITLVAILTILLILPYLVKHILIGQIEDQGFENVSIDDLSINLFYGTVKVENVYLHADGEQKLAVGSIALDYRWQGIFSGGIVTELVELKDTTLSIIEDDNGELEVVIPIPAAEQQATVSTEPQASIALPKLDVDLIRFSNITFKIKLQNLKAKLKLDEFSLTRVSTWHDYPAKLTLLGQFNDATFDINIAAEPLAEVPVLEGQIDIQHLQLSDFNGLLANSQSSLNGVVNSRLSFAGQRPSESSFKVKTNGVINIEKFALQYLPLQVALQTLAIDFDTEVNLVEDQLSFEVAFNTLINDLIAKDSQQDLTLFAAQQINLQKIKLDQQINLEIAKVDLQQLALLNIGKDDQQMLKVNNLSINAIDFNLQQNSLTFDQLLISTLNAMLSLDQDYQLMGLEPLDNFLAALSPTASNDASVTANEVDQQLATNADMFAFKVNRIKIAKDSKIHIEKQMPNQNVVRDIFIDELNLADIDNSQPQATSLFNLKARVGEFSTIDISGEGQFFAENLNLQAEGELDSLSLARMSPLIESALGYQFISGQYDHKFNLSLVDNKIDMQNELLIRKIKIEESEQGKQQTSAADMLPLPMAISMLEDADGHIELKVPITGDLDNAEVGMQAIIQKALGAALREGSMSFLKLALQPYGSVVFAAEFLIEQANNVNFEPILYQVNSSTLAAEQQLYADKLVELLVARQQIHINLCGYSNIDDKQQIVALQQAKIEQLKPAVNEQGAPQPTPNPEAEKILAQKIAELQLTDAQLNQQLAELAEGRANNLKAYFINKGIDGKRLFLCNSKYADKAITGVSLSM